MQGQHEGAVIALADTASSIRRSESRDTRPYSYSKPHVPDQSTVPSGKVMPEGCVLAVSQVFPLGWACGFAVHHAFSAFSFLDYLVADFCLAVLGLLCCARAFSCCGAGPGGYSLVAVWMLLLWWSLSLQGTSYRHLGLVVAAHKLSCSESECRSVVSDSLRPHGLFSSILELGSRSLLQGIFPTQGLNHALPHCRRILYQLSH